MSYFPSVSVQQNAQVDVNNSSIVNLPAGNAFTGTFTSTLIGNSIQVTLKTDQNCAVEVQQSPDHINWDITDTFTYYYSVNNFSRTIQAVNSYVRVIVTNIGIVTTTYFRLQTVLCPIIESLPRATDEFDRLRANSNLSDNHGFDAEFTPMGELRAISPVRLVGATFEGTIIDPNFWTSTPINAAIATQANAEIVLSSGVNTAGSIKLNSIRRSRYVSGSSMRFRAIMQLGDTGTVNNIRKWGIAWGATLPTITDGVYFQLSGTNFSVVLLKGGVTTNIASGSFNGTIGATYAPSTNCTSYEIYWTNGKVHFVVGDLLLHTFTASAATWSGTMNHHIYMENTNSGNTTNVILRSRTASIYRLGNLNTNPQYAHISTNSATPVVLKYGPGTLHSISINKAGSGINVLTVYDNTTNSAPIVGIYDTNVITTWPLNLSFNNGLTVVLNTGTAADITFVYE